MPYLPDGTYISEEDLLAQQQAQLSAHTPISTAGKIMGTNFNFTPWQGGGSLDLGWDQAKNIDAGVTFDQDVGFPYVSGYDASIEGMADLGTGGSSSTLGLTAGVKNVPGSLSANPYIDATISDVVPGLTVGAGTDTTPFASYFGDQDSVLPGLGITKASSGPIDVSYATELMGLPSGGSVNLNLGTAGGGSGGVTFEGTPSDLGTLGRRVWGGVKDLFSPINTAGAARNAPIGMFVNRQHPWAGEQSIGLPSPRMINPYAPVRPTDPLSIHPLNPLVTAPALGYSIPISTFLAQHTGEGAQPGEPYSGMGDAPDPMFTGHPGMMGATGYDLSEPTTAGMANVFTGAGTYTGDPDLGLEEPVISPLDIIGLGIPALGKAAVKGIGKALTKGATKKSTGDVVPLGVTKKGKTVLSDEMGPIAVVDSTDPVITTAQAAAKQINKIGNPYARQMARAKAIEDAKSAGASAVQIAVASAALSPKGALERTIEKSQPAGPSAAEIARQNAVNAQMAQEAAARQRQQQQAVAAEQARQAQAAADAQAASAAQAQAAQNAARAVLARLGQDRNMPSQRELNAARGVLSQVDTFDSGNPFEAQQAADRASVAIDASRRGGGPF